MAKHLKLFAASITLLIFLILTSLTGCHRLSFGENCDNANNTSKCSPRALLNCSDENKCDCVKPDEMIFDKNVGKCLVLARQKCEYNPYSLTEEEKPWLEKLDCVPNAVCHQDKRCRCSASFYEDYNGLCIPRKLESENCTHNFECITPLCYNRKCSCDPATSVFLPGTNKCAAYTGRHQTYEDHNLCVPNAHYDYSSGGCSCSYGYKLSDDGKCLGKFGRVCGIDNGCVNNLKCIGGLCKCPFRTHQVYDDETLRCNCNKQSFQNISGECQGTYGMYCDDKVRCIGGLNCINKLCQCPCASNDDLQQADDLKEVITCSATQPCKANLRCIDGGCKCPFPLHQYYNSDSDKCLSYVQGPCQEILDGAVVSFDCVPNSECKSLKELDECVCKAGYTMTDVRECKLGYGQPCPSYDECNTFSGLICNNGNCTCPNLQTYDEEMQQCKGLVGATCDKLEIGFCIDGAVCEPFLEGRGRVVKTTGVCRCNKQHKQTRGRRCVPARDDENSLLG